MKIILLKDVPKIGRKYDVKNVSDGYAQNFLIPRGLAKIATNEIVKEVEETKKRRDEKQKIKENLLDMEISKLKDTVLEIKSKLNDKGHLFASIRKEEVSKELSKKLKMDIDTEYIQLEHPIKEAGEHIIKIKIGKRDVEFKVLITG